MNWLRRLLRKSQAERQLDSEIRFHLDEQVTEYIAAGLPPDAARRRARLEFGGVDQVKEECHDVGRGRVVETFLQDVRYGLRMLRKNPGFTTIAVLTLALGIGANTAIFSLVNGVLLRSLSFSQPERLIAVNGTYPKGAFVAMREQIRTMDVGAYYQGYELNLTGAGDPVRLNGTLISAELFSVLGAPAQLGRTLRPGEDLAGKNSFVILSHTLWQEKFAGDPGIVGHWIDLEGVQREVIGVMPAEFRFPSLQTDVWIPLDIDSRNEVHYWGDDFMPVVGKLRSGSTIEQASAELRLFQSHVSKMFPWPMPATWNPAVSAVPLQSAIVGDFQSRLLILLGAVALVLLIACANVANLTLSRAATREKEIALRAALGASRSRIVRQLITESTVLASVGGALGLILAWSGLSLIKASLPANTPRLAEVGMDWRVLIFTATLAILTGLVSGLAPALQSSRTAPTEALKAGGRGSSASVSRLRKALVLGELALAVLLVSSAGLLIRSLWALSHMNPGFGSDHIITARITPNESFCDDRGRCDQFYRAVVEQTRAIPGVTDAAIVNTLPLGGRVNKRAVDFEGYVPSAGEPDPLVWENFVSPDYFHLMGITVIRGRGFSNADSAGTPLVAIVSARTARRFWPNSDALGKHMQAAGDKNSYTIVGVVPDVRAYDLQHEAPTWINGTVYVPYGPKATISDGTMPAEMTLVVRTSNYESQIGKAIHDIAFDLNPEAPVSELKTMPGLVSEAMSAPRSATYLFAAFAGLAFVLGVVGIYGVISFFVGQRTREIGIRMALGAQRRDVLKMVVREGLSLTLTGVVIGLVAALGLTHLLGSLLYGVSATDPLALGSVAVLFAVVALAACYLPARRAVRVDPAVALREE
jgi:putative ABC transport system permease protein